MIEREYILCEKELRKKTEEAEKLKSEVKDLKEMLKLEEQLEEHGEEDPFIMKNGFKRTSPQAKPSPVKSKMSNKDTSSNSWKENRKQMVGNKAQEFNCLECDYQGTKQEELSKHIRTKHTSQVSMKCRNCEKQFDSKPSLMIHRKTEHLSTVALCRNNLARKCSFTAHLCWWKHSEEQAQDIECYFCENSFESRTSVMMHRKRIHPKTVKPCTQFLLSKCSFKEDTCWFK